MPYATDFEFEALEAAKNYRRAIAAEFAPFLQGHVLEIGAGIGQISREVLQLSDVSRLSLIEPDPEFAEHLRTLGQGTNVHQGTVADYPQGDPIDAIYSVNVLEHIEEDLEELKRYRDLLVNGGGHFCTFVPARQELYAPLDERFGHFRRYDKTSLRAKLDDAGFTVVHMRYFNFPGYFLWWLEFRLIKQPGFNIDKVRVFDRWVFPIIHCIETRLFSPPLGQSLLVVARA